MNTEPTIRKADTGRELFQELMRDGRRVKVREWLLLAALGFRLFSGGPVVPLCTACPDLLDDAREAGEQLGELPQAARERAHRRQEVHTLPDGTRVELEYDEESQEVLSARVHKGKGEPTHA